MPRVVLKWPDGVEVRPNGALQITIGRHADNVLAIEDEKASRFHCVVEPNGRGGFRVRDLVSRNGTKINGERVSERDLLHGDTLRIGAHEFEVWIEGDAPGIRARSTGKSAAGGEGKASPWAEDFREAMNSLPPQGAEEERVSLLDASGRPSEALAGAGEGPLAVRLMLQLASKSRATDIHVEPKGEVQHIRIRVDGQMVSITELPAKVGGLVGGLIKSACHMLVAGREAVQEGHFSAKFPDRQVEYRVSFTPSVHGQKLVMRVLDERGSPRSLDDLGLASYMYDRVRRTCEQDHGLLLVCGPTGSGKTTTLHNALRQIDRTVANVVTIEDPVEYQLDHVTQIPIDENKGNTFGQLLRSVLRQDPDVIMVGEVRDEETARTAMQAAMTGHLVFSTVHAKDTMAAIFRLLDLKVEPYLVASSLDLVLAQRLVRVLCEMCKQSIPVSPGQATRVGRFLGNKTKVFAATGCGRCLRTGYRGRRAIFELLDFNDELRDVIIKEPTIAAMKRVIEQGLFTTLVQSGWKLVGEGVTSFEEVDQVAGSG